MKLLFTPRRRRSWVRVGRNIYSEASLDEVLQLLANRLELFFDTRNTLLSYDVAGRWILMPADRCNGVHGLRNQDLEMRGAQRRVHGDNLWDGKRTRLDRADTGVILLVVGLTRSNGVTRCPAGGGIRESRDKVIQYPAEERCAVASGRIGREDRWHAGDEIG